MHPTDFPVHYARYRSDTGWEAIDDRVISEISVELAVNGQAWLSFACTPTRLDALAVGFLFNEGLIQSRAEIAVVDVCPQGDYVDVWLEHKVERPAFWQRTSGCTGGVTGVSADTTPSGHHAHDEPLLPPPLGQGEEPVTLLPHELNTVEPGALLRGMEQLLSSQDLYREVGGVHSSALSNGQALLAHAEDIGRHNTIDKLAGMILLDELAIPSTPAPTLILLTTGRISSEMLQKAARMGVKVVASRTSPTSRSLLLAYREGVTLVGYARRNGFEVYTHPGRIKTPN